MDLNKKYTPTYINGNPYAVVLPTGGEIRKDKNNMWDQAMDALRDHNKDLHFCNMFSWCQNEPKGLKSMCTIRGFADPKEYDYEYATCGGTTLGYRPFMIPLNSESLLPDPSRLQGYKDGTTFCMGTLYMDRQPLQNPQNPSLPSDTPNYTPGTDLRIGDSHEDPKNHIRWLKAGDFLVADRNLIKNISWEDLDKQGLAYGNRDEREMEDIQAAYSVMQNMSPDTFAVARNMHYIQSYFGNDFLSHSELTDLAKKVNAAARFSSVPVLNEERLDAVCCLLSYGIEGNRCPDLSEADPETTKDILLSAEIEAFTTIVDTAALGNRDHYVPDNEYSINQEALLREANAVIKQATEPTQEPITLADKLASAETRKAPPASGRAEADISRQR